MAGTRPTTRPGMIDKFLGAWNNALVYDFGGTSDGFASHGALPKPQV
jgi:phosphate-selective porin OprO/OprP